MLKNSIGSFDRPVIAKIGLRFAEHGCELEAVARKAGERQLRMARSD